MPEHTVNVYFAYESILGCISATDTAMRPAHQWAICWRGDRGGDDRAGKVKRIANRGGRGYALHHTLASRQRPL